jgi:hypothetical protein
MVKRHFISYSPYAQCHCEPSNARQDAECKRASRQQEGYALDLGVLCHTNKGAIKRGLRQVSHSFNTKN